MSWTWCISNWVVFHSRNSDGLESGQFAGRSADYAWQLLLNACSILVSLSYHPEKSLIIEYNTGIEHPTELIRAFQTTAFITDHAAISPDTRRGRVDLWTVDAF